MDKSFIINEIKKHYNFKKDSEFANHLGISPQMLSNWKARNTYDAELLYINCLEISPEWLLTGKGSMLKSEIVQINPVISEVDQVYKELAESRLEVINGLKLQIASLEEKLSELRNTRSDPFLHTNVAKPAPELVGEKRK
jgi:hypothetical protein